MGDIDNLRRLVEKVDRDGVESLTDEERQELKEEYVKFASDVENAMLPVIEAHTDAMRELADACEPLMKYSKAVKHE